MRQTLQQRKGEVHFRSFHGQFVERYTDLFRSLITMRFGTLDRLVFDGELRSPYLEIGAELGLNGSVLASRHGLSGVCMDISPDALQTGRSYGERFGLKSQAALVCADAHNLPFRNDSFAGVLAWGTLHHFPDPTPVLREARRVLHPTGKFIFEEEPIRRRLSLNLYNTGTPPDDLRWYERLLMRLGLLPFIAIPGGKMEVEQGIHEGTFRISELNRLLSVFDESEVRYVPQLTGGIPAEGKLLRRLLPKFLGLGRAFAWATRWFGGASGGRAVKHTTGCRLLPGDPHTVMVKRREPFDLITLVTNGAAEVGLSGADTAADSNESGNGIFTHRVRLPDNLRSNEIVVFNMAGDGELLRVELESSGDAKPFYSWRPYKESTAEVSTWDLLGCPSCIEVTDRCLAPRCGWPCIEACPRGALRPGKDRPEYDKSKCDLCMQCLHACPFGALDRSPLDMQGENATGDGILTCRYCGESFIIRDGIVVLLAAGERELLSRSWE